MLDQLLELRFITCCLVTGYLQEAVVKQIGHEWKGMTLHYIQNDQWETTNNIVSLEVGVGALTTDFLLIEGDLLVKTELLASILTPNAMALCRFAPPMNGTVVELDSEGLVKRFFVSNEDHYPIRPEDYYKTINLYSFDYEAFTKQISPVLQHYLAEGRTHTYYESAIAHAVMQQGFALQAHIF